MLHRHRKNKINHYAIAIVLAVLFGVGSTFFFVQGLERAIKDGLKTNLIASSIDLFSWVEWRSGGVISYQAELPPPASWPEYHYYKINPLKPVPTVSAKAYLLADVATGEILAAKKPDQILPMASLVKIITALTSFEVVDQSQVATVSAEAVATYSEAGSLKAGEKLPIGELIYPLLLESSNDAAEVIAGQAGRSNFVNQMNQKARAIGLANTSLTDPSGVDAGNQSSANDLFVLLQYLFNSHPDVLSLTKTYDHSFAGHRWVNSNEAIKDERFVGGKNGRTTAAAATFAGLFDLSFGGVATRTIGVVLLGSDDRIDETNRLLDYLTGNIYWAAETSVGRPVNIPKATTSLVFVGDIMLDRGVKRSIIKNGAGNYDYAFHRAPFLNQADIAFANLEGPISDQGVDRHNLYSFRMDPKSIEALVNAGFDVLSVANNHIGDWGREAMVDTFKRLNLAKIVYTGGGFNQVEAGGVKIIEKNGVKFGFVGFSDVGPNDLAAKGDQAGILIASEETVAKTVDQASKQVDVLVVSFHFGNEYQTAPTARQKTLAKLAIDRGAKIVVGHHPHVVGPLEFYHGGVIAYSLGNFIFDQYFSAETMHGAALMVEMAEANIVTIALATTTMNYQFIPELAE